MKDKEAKLIKACLQKNRSAMESLYNQYAKQMFSVASRYTKNSAEAEDILQESFIKVFDHLERYRPETTLGSWIKRIVVNTAIDSYRKRRVMTIVDDGVDGIPENSYEIDEHETEELDSVASVQILRVQIARLPEQYRTVLNLYAIEGYSHKEISNTLNISESASRSNYSRAKRKLTDYLKELASTTVV